MIILCRYCGSAACEHGDHCASCGCPKCGYPGYRERTWCPDCGHQGHPQARRVWKQVRRFQTPEERYNDMLSAIGQPVVYHDMAGKVLFPFEELFTLVELDLLESRP